MSLPLLPKFMAYCSFILAVVNIFVVPVGGGDSRCLFQCVFVCMGVYEYMFGCVYVCASVCISVCAHIIYMYINMLIYLYTIHLCHILWNIQNVM